MSAESLQVRKSPQVRRCLQVRKSPQVRMESARPQVRMPVRVRRRSHVRSVSARPRSLPRPPRIRVYVVSPPTVRGPLACRFRTRVRPLRVTVPLCPALLRRTRSPP
eukprot:6204526-Pleurochrysis_carterae.AAC.1